MRPACGPRVTARKSPILDSLWATAERNSQHYFRGLDHLPPAEASSAARAHTDLYEERTDGIFLRIQGGSISLRSLQAPGLGHGVTVAFEARTPLEEWTFERLEEPVRDV